jgi:hypothetical protein
MYLKAAKLEHTTEATIKGFQEQRLQEEAEPTHIGETQRNIASVITIDGCFPPDHI